MLAKLKLYRVSFLPFVDEPNIAAADEDEDEDFDDEVDVDVLLAFPEAMDFAEVCQAIINNRAEYFKPEEQIIGIADDFTTVLAAFTKPTVVSH